MTDRIVLKDINKTFKIKTNEKLAVLDHVNMAIKTNEFVSIIGASGCGKSTIFRLITGLDQDYSGHILIDGEEAKDSKQRISYMQQKDLLMPWRTIMDNVILPLEIMGISKGKARKKADKYLEEFGLNGFEMLYPKQLSGGMRQRAALLRTFLMDSNMMLLDEPFGALDAITRSAMQQWLLKVWREHKKSVLFITHDIDEAIFLSDRIYVLSERPASVALELEVDFKRPRDKEILLSNQYLNYKKQIKEILTAN
jgi:NitT/TauT family transport system ATP-binding protein